MPILFGFGFNWDSAKSLWSLCHQFSQKVSLKNLFLLTIPVDCSQILFISQWRRLCTFKTDCTSNFESKFELAETIWQLVENIYRLGQNIIYWTLKLYILLFIPFLGGKKKTSHAESRQKLGKSTENLVKWKQNFRFRRQTNTSPCISPFDLVSFFCR